MSPTETIHKVLSIILDPPVVGEAWDTMDFMDQSIVIDQLKELFTEPEEETDAC